MLPPDIPWVPESGNEISSATFLAVLWWGHPRTPGVVQALKQFEIESTFHPRRAMSLSALGIRTICHQKRTRWWPLHHSRHFAFRALMRHHLRPDLRMTQSLRHTKVYSPPEGNVPRAPPKEPGGRGELLPFPATSNTTRVPNGHSTRWPFCLGWAGRTSLGLKAANSRGRKLGA